MINKNGQVQQNVSDKYKHFSYLASAHAAVEQMQNLQQSGGKKSSLA